MDIKFTLNKFFSYYFYVKQNKTTENHFWSTSCEDREIGRFKQHGKTYVFLSFFKVWLISICQSRDLLEKKVFCLRTGNGHTEVIKDIFKTFCTFTYDR